MKACFELKRPTYERFPRTDDVFSGTSTHSTADSDSLTSLLWAEIEVPNWYFDLFQLYYGAISWPSQQKADTRDESKAKPRRLKVANRIDWMIETTVNCTPKAAHRFRVSSARITVH